ncbi:hypothetical protein C8J57DRAFT_1562023 [Mycena rebaudengoi]|nr:hypothetical protein C8J57DRAFT_1562023 [Mycena rebaudengoi]
MKVPTQHENLIEYTTATASTPEEISGSFQIPFLSSATVLTLSILKCVEDVRSNRDEWMIIVEQIHEILCTITTLVSTSEIKGMLPTALLYDIAKFTETLQKIFILLKAQQQMGRFKQLFKQPDTAAKLETCKQELHQAIGMFRVRAGGSALSQMGHVKKDAKQQHDELMALLNAHLDLGSSDRSSVIGTLSSSGNSSGSFSLLPASPKIFYGHESELKDVVNILLQNSAHVAILGTGGMGKTSLATTALHKPQVEANPTCTELAATIADHIGLEKGSNMVKKVAHYFSHAPPSLLVLDNLETSWETLSSRSEVEEFLSLLTDVPHLGLMITLRGTERPSKVKWTRPFLAPLEPLSNMAAQQTFIDVADDIHDDAIIKELLDLTGNLPLAVSLIASVADSEGCAKALSRWKLESQDQYLKVLVPIREHILSMHPPKSTLKLKLREHFHQILDLWNQFKNLNVADILAQISKNLGNFNAILRDGLESDVPDIVQNFESILSLNQFHDRVQDTYSPLLLQLSGKMLHWRGNPIFGEYLIQLLQSSGYFPDLDLNSDIASGTQHFQSTAPLEQAKWYRALGMHFQWAKSDLEEALKYHCRAYSLAESIGYPTIVGIYALADICSILSVTGKPSSALTHAEEAYRSAGHIGDMYGQAQSLYLQGRCHTQLANYWHAQGLLQKSRHILTTLGQQQSVLMLDIQNYQAEIHFVKSEYLESRKLQVAIVSSCQPTSYIAILANLNMALIDIATGVDSKIVGQNLEIAQSHLKALLGYSGRQMSIFIDYVAAELWLRDGTLGAANAMFQKCFPLSLDIIDAEQALLCVERLGDLSTGMNAIQTTLQWYGILLGLALKCKHKRPTMHAF